MIEEAKLKEINDPEAMALSTVSDEGTPSVRMVLLRKLWFWCNLLKYQKGSKIQMILFRKVWFLGNSFITLSKTIKNLTFIFSFLRRNTKEEKAFSSLFYQLVSHYSFLIKLIDRKLSASFNVSRDYYIVRLLFEQIQS